MPKKFYTTGEVAKIIGIAERTAKNYCTLGKIVSEKTPITNYRRISKENLLKFLEENGLSPDLLETHKGKKRILIVDDDPDIVELIRVTLSEISEDLIIDTAGDGYDACIKAGILLPDLVLLDLKLPKADGFEVCRSIRSNEATKHARIIIMTGYAAEDNLQKIREFHPLAVFEKPLDWNLVSRRIKLLLAGQSKH